MAFLKNSNSGFCHSGYWHLGEKKFGDWNSGKCTFELFDSGGTNGKRFSQVTYTLVKVIAIVASVRCGLQFHIV